MAGSGDRARYFLEQSLPELRELLQKEIFSRAEISAITKKRSDFEHVLNARGSRPADYIRYIAYEQNLESLKRKRVQRAGVKNLGYTGPRRTFFLFERATRKFPHDIRIWMQYINYAKSQRAHKRLGKILTCTLRLHPLDPDLWIYAAKYAMNRNDSPAAARGYFQRALRFCPKEKQLWIEYCSMEMMFIARISENLENMGVQDLGLNKKDANEDNEIGDEDEDLDDKFESNDGRPLPEPEPKALESLDNRALKEMASAPALSGSIPRALFDAAMNEFRNDRSLAEQFFDIYMTFSKLACTRSLLEQVLDHLTQHNLTSATLVVCRFKAQFFGLNPISFKFFSAFSHAIATLMQAISDRNNPAEKAEIAEKAVLFILPIIALDELDAEARFVLEEVVNSLATNLLDVQSISNLILKLHVHKHWDDDLAQRLTDRFSSNKELFTV